MNCSDFDRRLNQLLDERRAPENDPSVSQHAAGCSRCGDMLRLQTAVFSQFRGDSDDRRILAAQPKASPASNVMTGWSRWAFAASACLCLLVAARLLVPGGINSSQNLSGRSVEMEDDISVREGRPLQLAATSWGLTVPFQCGVAISQFDFGWSSPLASADANSSGAWFEPVECGFAPLAESLASTLNVLRATWTHSLTSPPQPIHLPADSPSGDPTVSVRQAG